MIMFNGSDYDSLPRGSTPLTTVETPGKYSCVPALLLPYTYPAFHQSQGVAGESIGHLPWWTDS